MEIQMKNRLIAAFLMLTAVPFLANEAPIHQPTNAERLAHLKTTKKDIEHMIQGLNIASKEMQKGCAFGRANYFFLLNMINEIDQQLNHSLKNRILGESSSETVKLICNDMKTIDDINDIINTSTELLLESGFLGSTTNDEKETALITSIFTKHHKKYCLDNPDEDLIEMQFTDLCHSDTLAPFFLSIIIERFNELLHNIKIAELSLPFEALAK
jgi:hypothetical protein